MVWAVSFGLVNWAFFPAKSASTTPRAAAHFPQTKIGIFSSMTLARASLKGGQPTGVTLSETGVRMRTVASPASSMRTSLPASFSAPAQTKGKFARVGFSEPHNPTSRNLCPVEFSGCSAARAEVALALAITATHIWPAFWRTERRVVIPPSFVGSYGNTQEIRNLPLHSSNAFADG